MNKIKVLHVINNMNDGGAQKIILNYLNDMKNSENVTLELVCLYNQFNDFYLQKLNELGVKVTSLIDKKNKYKFKIFNIVREMFIINKKLINYLNTNKIDIIHLHLCRTVIYSFPTIFFKKIPLCFYTIHSNPLRFSGVKLFLMRKFLTKKNVVSICVNEEQLSIAQRHYKVKKHEVIHNGVNFKEIDDKIIEKNTARKKFGLNINDFIIVSVGRLDKIKRFDFLVKIFADVQKNKTNSKLVIAGDGVEKQNLLNLAKEYNVSDKLILLGNISNVTDLYCASDVVVITSKSETASLVFIEAQRCNVKCVISDGVPSESILSEKVIKMKNNSSIQEWTNAIINVKMNYEKPKLSYNDYDECLISKKMESTYLKYYTDIKWR